MPWSTTVVRVKRMHERKMRRVKLIIAVAALVLFCGVCSIGGFIYSRGSAATRATPTSSISIVHTPAPGWTPISQAGEVAVKFATFTPMPR